MSQNKNEKEKLSLYFSDDSSTEEDLLRIVNKLEAMKHQEKTKQKMTPPTDGSSTSSGANRQYCPNSASSDSVPESSPSIPTSVELNECRELSKKQDTTTRSDDDKHQFNRKIERSVDQSIEKEKSIPFRVIGEENQKDPQQLQARHHAFHSKKNQDIVLPSNTTTHGTLPRRSALCHEEKFSEESSIDQIDERQEHKCPRSLQRVAETRNKNQAQKQPIATTIHTNSIKNGIINQKKENTENLNGNIKDGVVDCDYTDKKKRDDASKKKLKEAIVDHMKTGSTISPSDSPNSSDCSSSSSYSDLTHLSTSSSLSEDSAYDSEKLPPDGTGRSDPSTQRQLHSISHDIPTVNSHEKQPKNYTNAVPHCNKVPDRDICASGSNKSEVPRILKGTANEGAPNGIKGHENKRRSPRELGRQDQSIRNPYLRKRNAGDVSVNQATTNDQENRHRSPSSNSKNNGDDRDKRSKSHRSRSPDESTALSPTKNPTEPTIGETIVYERPESGEIPQSEVPHSLYAPPPYHEGRSPPILHRFNSENHPFHSRHSISVAALNRIFASVIVNSLWVQKFDHFNHFQSVMVNTLSNTDDNAVVSAPTGAGKSTLFEIAIARFLTIDLRAQEHHFKTSNLARSSLISKARKIVYIAPSKALCEERYSDWSQRLKNMNLGLEVALITGQDVGNEQATTSFSDLLSAHLIVTTPEKWDSMTRRWNESFFLFASIKLLLLDEVHLLGDNNRGWCLESIVTRMKTIQRAALALSTTPDEINTSTYPETNPEAIGSSFRTVAVSATLPNIIEVAEFLQASEAYSFDDSYRPVPLTKHVNALGRVGNNEWRFWSNLSEHVPEIIKRFSHGKQSLVFCHSKKETQRVTELLIRRNFGNRGIRMASPPWKDPVEYMLGHGIGYHHAGMSKDERKTIEEAFLKKKIKYLAATSTLAVGVNLPAHLVVIVGTKAWRNNEKGKGYQEIEVSALLQMVGRAGRPGLDSSGVAVVLTDNSSKEKVEGLLEAGIGPARSNLVQRLPEVLNTEISHQVITTMDEALRWLQTTFVYSCLKNKEHAIGYLKKLCGEALTHLEEIGMVEIGDMHSIRPLSGSFIMNRSMVSFDEMKAIVAFNFDASRCQILRSMSKLDRLQSFVKRNEKRELREFHKSDSIKYKLPGSLSKFTVKDPSQKAFILLQSHISRHKYDNESLNDEQLSVRDDAIKFLEVVQEYCVKATKHGKLALECYKLQRSLNCSLWGESSGVFNQFGWIGLSKTASNVLTFDGIRSFQDVLEFSEQKLDEIFAKAQVPNLPKNAGRIVKHTARDLCRHRLTLSTKVEYTRNSNIPADLLCSLKFYDPTVAMVRKKAEQDLKFSLIAFTDNSVDSSLIFEENICSPSSFRVPLPARSFQYIYVHLVGTWVGFDQVKIISVSGNNVMLPQNPAANPGIRQQESTKMKKRKLRGVEKSSHINQGLAVKRHCKAGNKMGKPSQITPQIKNNDSGKISSSLIVNKQFDEEFWNDTKRDCQSIQSSTLLITPRRSNIIKPQNGGTSSSTSVIPTMRLPIENTLCRTQIPSKKGSSDCGCPHMTGYENSAVSGFDQYWEQTTVDHDKIPTSDIYPPTKNESKIQGYHWEGKKRQVDHVENGMMAHHYRKTSNQKLENLTNLRKGTQEKMIWKQSRTKQQRDQKRAFTEKKMNPFRSFSHDPNDFERHLEQLSQQSRIIPNPVLAKMKRSSIASNRRSQRHFSWKDRNRRARTGSSRHLNENPQHVLREKASEQQFQHEMIMSRHRSAINHMPSVNALQETYDEYQSFPSVDSSQSNLKAPQNSHCRSSYQLPYSKNIQRHFHVPQPLYPSIPIQHPGNTSEIYKTKSSSHYQPCDGVCDHSSSTIQIPRNLQVQNLNQEYDQIVRTENFDSFDYNADTQSQNQHWNDIHPLEENQDPFDFKVAFRDAFY